MRALTLWQPWAWAILHLPEAIAKPVENRDWMPPRALLGQRIALHGGKTYRPEVSLDISEATGWTVDRLRRDAPGKHAADQGILGTVRLVGVVEERRGRLELVAGGWGEVTRERCEPWFVGRYGWLFDQRRVLGPPIPCRGAQGLWTVPDDLATRLVA